MAAFDAEILPGKAGKVTAQLATENYRGAVDKAITVTSNDPKNSTTVLHLKATIVGSVEVLPRMFLGFPSYPLWDFSAKLLVRKVKSETGELKITDLTSTAPWLTARSRKVEKPEPEADGLPALVPGDWVIDIAVGEDAPAGQSSQQSVKFKTGLTREPLITIPVAVALAQPMMAIPPSLVVTVPEGTRETSTSFGLVARPGIGKQAIKVEASPAQFTATMQPENDRRYKVTVQWKGLGDDPVKSGNVVVKAGSDTLTVPVRVLERPAMSPARTPGAGQGEAPAPGQPQKLIVPGTAPAPAVVKPAP